jgi:hypothetical protein
MFSNDTILQRIWDHLIAKVTGDAAPNYGLSPFGEQLITPLTPMTGWSFTYNINDDFCAITTTGSGTTSISVGRGRVHSGAAINSSAQIETRRPLRYIPGVGAVVRMTAIFTEGVVGSTQLMGVGDDNDGYFFGFNGEVFGILRRHSGADFWIAQNEWNIASMLATQDGSDQILDVTLGNVYSIHFQWLGYGGVSFFIEDASTGKFQEVHRIPYANSDLNTSIRNPTLPLTMKVENTSNNTGLVISSSSAMGFVAGAMQNPSLIHPTAALRNEENAVATVITEVPILSVKAATTFQSITSRVHSLLKHSTCSVDGNQDAVFKLYKHRAGEGDGLTGESFAEFNADTSTLSFDKSASAHTGGRLIATIPVSKNSTKLFDFESFGIDIGPDDSLTITAATSGGGSNIAVNMDLFELF